MYLSLPFKKFQASVLYKSVRIWMNELALVGAKGTLRSTQVFPPFLKACMDLPKIILISF